VRLQIALVLVSIAACGGNDRTEIKRAPERPRRVIEPPAGRVRALPPHAIRADGVGPYRLGTALAEVSDQLPSGPALSLFEIRGVVHRSLLRADDAQILIGGEPLGKASFVAVVGADVARTESGVHVGSTRDDIARALGDDLAAVDRARDPRVAAPANMPDARVVFDGDRALAFVIRADAGDAARNPARPCPRPDGEPPRRVGTCLTGAGETIEHDGDEIIVRADNDRVLAKLTVSGLVFAAPLRDVAEDRDELVAIARVDDAQARTWTIAAYRLEGARFVKVLDATPR
jgi:hypothetical protein